MKYKVEPELFKQFLFIFAPTFNKNIKMSRVGFKILNFD